MFISTRRTKNISNVTFCMNKSIRKREIGWVMLKEHKKSRISQLLDLWGMDSTHPNTDLYGVGKEYDGAKMLLNFSMKKKNENFF